MDKVLVDLLGTVLEISVAMVFYESFWVRKKIKRSLLVLGLSFIAALVTTLTAFLQNTIILPILSIPIMFILSLYFSSSFTSKVLFSIIITAILFSMEQLLGVFYVNIMEIPIEQVQNDILTYMVGVLASKLFAMVMVIILRLINRGSKQEVDRQFNSLMIFMAIQSIILCFLVYNYSISTNRRQASGLGFVAVIISLALIFVIMHVLKNQRKAFVHEKEYESAQFRLETQLEHYQKLYQSQREIKSIRHEIGNNLIIISGMLREGLVDDAIDRISGIQSDVQRTADIVDTGLSQIDAVLNAKISRATESDILIIHKVLIDDNLNISQFDLAAIIANALDNSIEGILRGSNVEKSIWLNVASASDYISVVVENYSSGPVNDAFRTSKPDEKNHGFGITQMRAIAKKYMGDVQPSYDQATGRFSLQVLLKNKSA